VGMLSQCKDRAVPHKYNAGCRLEYFHQDTAPL